MGEAVNEPHLQRVVNRIGAGLIEIETVGIWNLERILRIQWAGPDRRPIRSAEQIQIGSLGAGVGQIQDPILREGCFGAQGPNLSVSVFIKWIDAAFVGDDAGSRKAILERENLGGR